MNRGVRTHIKGRNEKEAIVKTVGKQKLNRSRSKSRSRSPQRGLNKSTEKLPKTSRGKNANNKNNRERSRSIQRSKSKKGLEKSVSTKKIKRNISQPKMNTASKAVTTPSNNKQQNNSKILAKTPGDKKNNISKQHTTPQTQRPQPTIKQQQKDMGLILLFPEHQKITMKPIDTLDEIFDKFLQMISNDNDASYVMNALPEFRDMKKDDDTSGRDFISGKITRLSGVFDNITVQKVTGPLRKVPIYYNGQCGKNLQILKISLQTKFKIQVDIGFLQYSLDGDKLTIFRIYISRIYRKMNYTAFAYLEILKLLMEKHPGADRWSIFILERNINIHKFFKYMGLKIEKVLTDSKNKTFDYYQQFCIKKKELQTAVSAFK